MQQQLKRADSKTSSKIKFKVIILGFYKPIKKNKLRTFDTITVTEIMKVNGNNIAVKKTERRVPDYS